MRTLVAVLGISAALAVGGGQASADPLPLTAPAPIATSGPVVLPPQTSAPYTGSVQPGTPCQASCGTQPPWLS